MTGETLVDLTILQSAASACSAACLAEFARCRCGTGRSACGFGGPRRRGSTDRLPPREGSTSRRAARENRCGRRRGTPSSSSRLRTRKDPQSDGVPVQHQEAETSEPTPSGQTGHRRSRRQPQTSTVPGDADGATRASSWEPRKWTPGASGTCSAKKRSPREHFHMSLLLHAAAEHQRGRRGP